VDRCDGDMESAFDRLRRNQAGTEETPGQFLCFACKVKYRDIAQVSETTGGGFGIAGPCLLKNQNGNEQTEFVVSFRQTCVRPPPIGLKWVLSPAGPQRFSSGSDSDKKHVPFNVFTFVSRTSSWKGLIQQCQLRDFIRFHE
jgi:hypothetical protein